MLVHFQCPRRSGSLYFNYKKYFSIVLLALANANYDFVFVDIGGFGREGDAALFHQSSFGRRIRTPTLPYDRGGMDIPPDNYIPDTNIRVPHVFLGDEAFPLSQHLMKPYRYRSANGAEQHCNVRFSIGRRVVENAFGVATARFRVLDGKINLAPEAADSVVKSLVVLHNYVKKHDAKDYAEPRYMPAGFVDYTDDQGNLVEGEWRRMVGDHNYVRFTDEAIENPARIAYDIRERFKNYFVSDIGKLPWQDRYVAEGRY